MPIFGDLFIAYLLVYFVNLLPSEIFKSVGCLPTFRLSRSENWSHWSFLRYVPCTLCSEKNSHFSFLA